MQCCNCQKETSNPRYCSRSCAAISNNKTSPKRKPLRKCKKCDKLVKHYRTKLCAEHLEEHKSGGKFKAKTLKESRLGLKGKHPMYLNNTVRGFARTWLKHLATQPCKNCGYSKHVELCHIVPISSFPETATLGEVNSEENVIPLCPNCHWELDHGLLSMDK